MKKTVAMTLEASAAGRELISATKDHKEHKEFSVLTMWSRGSTNAVSLRTVHRSRDGAADDFVNMARNWGGKWNLC